MTIASTSAEEAQASFSPSGSTSQTEVSGGHASRDEPGVMNGLHISGLLTLGLLGTATVQVRRARRRYGEAAPAVPMQELLG